MKKIIRLTESELMKLVENAAMKVLNEDGEALGSGGMCGGAMSGGGGASAGATSDSADRQGAYDVPFGGVQRKKIYSPKNKVDMRPTMKRHDGKGGSITISKNKA